MFSLLPETIINAIKQQFSPSLIYEIRLRENKPVVLNYAGRKCVLNEAETRSPLICSIKDINYCLNKATQSSVYAFSNQIKNGFISYSNGIRIGLAGECVFDDNLCPKTIKNITSISIRIPHEIKNCAHTALTFILNKGIKSTLIVGPPGSGKTTFLRDIARSLASKEPYNILIVDERFEIAGSFPNLLDVGLTSDVLGGATKGFAFEKAVRSLCPDCIICDEITTMKDAEAINFAVKSGVKTIATIHGESFSDLLNKPFSKFLIENKCFERIIILSSRNGPGTYEEILNENYNPIYSR